MKTTNKIACGIGAVVVLGMAALLGSGQRVEAASAPPSAPVDGFRVHEWGTFTVVPDENGLPLSWYDTSGATELPDFVHPNQVNRFGLGKSVMAQVRMETPVLYFYTNRQLQAIIDVDFPGGQVTEWYPHGGRVRHVSPNGRTTFGPFRWADVTLDPNHKASGPKATDDNHYFEARGVGSVPVQVATAEKKTEEEEFIFYRGIRYAAFQSLHAKVGKEEVLLAPNGEYAPETVIVFENRDGIMRWQEVSLTAGFLTVKTDQMQKMDRIPEAELRSWITQKGLTVKEADAMIATWKKSWFEPGLRVFHMLPQALVDKLLPLTVTPRPESVSRAFVTRTELLSPKRLDRIEKIVEAKTGKDLWEAADKELGRFALAGLSAVVNRHPEDKQLRNQVNSVIYNPFLRNPKMFGISENAQSKSTLDIVEKAQSKPIVFLLDSEEKVVQRAAGPNWRRMKTMLARILHVLPSESAQGTVGQ